ncbi:CHASE sensor domain-containing protein [Methylomonas koyamae]|uniref:CHASE sensor domain-containing protein n=1 Tax=Methylomonas koyamae TaxID=702114 RepID=UPI0006D14F24|nr:CHASE sensor domain-containing protein [Methylomonas koyamae]
MRVLPDFPNWSLRRKLLSIIMLSCAACLLVSLSAMAVSSAVSRYRNALQDIIGLADVLAENGQAALVFSDQNEARRLLNSLQEHQEIAAAGWSRPTARYWPTGTATAGRQHRRAIRVHRYGNCAPISGGAAPSCTRR